MRSEAFSKGGSAIENYSDNIKKAHRFHYAILPNGEMFDLNSIKTRRNNNITIFGASGAGKTRSFVIPNILSAVNSYIIADPKGNLYSQYADIMKRNGYNVIHIDLIRPSTSDKYNPLCYLRNSDDVCKLATQIVNLGYNGAVNSQDPFWDRAAELLLKAVIGLKMEDCYDTDRCINGVSELLTKIDFEDDDTFSINNSELNRIFVRHASRYMSPFGKSWAYEQYLKFKATPPRTLACILITIQTMLGPFSSAGLRSMTSSMNTVDFKAIGQEKTIVFLAISDTDRSKDLLANIFYSQAMNELCNFADYECENNRLPVPVRFILDDFGTNCRISGFENMISNIRSRDISAALILQSEAQLRHGYGDSAHTIIDNCDTIVYMGGNDVETARMISERCNQPLQKVLNMPIGTNWIFRRGEQPKFSRTVELSEYRIEQLRLGKKRSK